MDPKPFRGTLALLAVPGLLDQFRTVPAEFVRAHRDGKVKVLCPCGNRPVLEPGRLLSCRERATSPHRCHRMFVLLRQTVRVAYA